METFRGLENGLERIENDLEVSNVKDGEAVCVIKPDAYENRNRIVQKLEESGLYIVRRSLAELSEQFITNKMYSSIPEPILKATLKHFSSGPCEIVLVKGDNVINKLLKSTGLHTAPPLCDHETIRFIYGTHMVEELEEGYRYWRNAVHRAKNEKERIEDLSKFNNLL